MLDGLYTALAGMEAQQRSTDAMAQDIANLDTPGYKAQRVSFFDLLYSNTGEGTGAEVTVRPGTGQGTLYPTNRPLDVRIDGDGYIQVRRPDGTTALTRNGALQLDARRRLVTSSGDLLDPSIKLPAGTNPSEVTIAKNGTVSVGARRVGRIALVAVPAPTQLLAVGNSQFMVTRASGALRPATAATLQQRQLEASTADITEMVRSTHGFHFLSQVVKTQDQMGQIANQLIK